VYLSRYQPYALHVPTGDPTRRPLSVMFHGGDGSHVNELSEEAGLRVAAGLDDKAGAITLAPLGRGRRQPWWRGLGEADVLEAMADVQRVYRTDRDRQIANGASLGGYATVRLSSLYPDAWAGAVASCPANYENSVSARAPGNEVTATQHFTIEEVVPSLLQVPFRQISGTADPLVRIDSGHRLRDAALAAGLDFGYTEYPNSSHCFLVPSFTGGWMDNHTNEMAALLHAGRRQTPARVRYVVDARHYPAATEVIGIADVRDIGLGYSGANWLRDLTVRPDGEARATTVGRPAAGNTVGGPGPEVVALADAVSHARAGWRLAVSDCGQSIGLAGTGTGGNPDAEPDGGGATGLTWNNPNAWRCQSQAWDGGVEPGLELTTRNLSTAGIDLRGAGIDAQRTFEVRAAGDGPVALRLVGAARRVASGPCVTGMAPDSDALVVQLSLSATPCVVHIER
jgi:dienelactone hydrolase